MKLGSSADGTIRANIMHSYVAGQGGGRQHLTARVHLVDFSPRRLASTET